MPRRRAERAWCGRYIEEACAAARRQVLALHDLQPHYIALGDIFRSNPVRRIILLTCNVANASDFLDELATDLNVRVTAYTERVISRSERRQGHLHVWMYLEGDERNQGTNNDRADVELMPGISSSKVRTGRIRARIRQRTRRTPRVPPV